MLGMHGTYEANLAMHDCDVMVCIGARFDDRITGRLDAFSPGSRKIHIDIDPSSINKNVRVDIPVLGDCGLVLEEMVRVWKDGGLSMDAEALSHWWEQINVWRARDCLKYRNSGDVIMPQYAIQRLYEATKDRDTFITTEVGQHQMWTAQFYRFDKPNRLMTSGGLGTMGYGLPAALGVQAANPDALVIDIAGDASIQMNIQELATAIQHRLPVKVFRSGRGDPGDDRNRQAGVLRLSRGQPGQLLPDDPGRAGAQRNAARGRREGRRTGGRVGGYTHDGQGRPSCHSAGLHILHGGGEGDRGAPYAVRCRGQRARRSGPRDRPFHGPRLQHRAAYGFRSASRRGVSRITIVTKGTPHILEQIRSQLRRLVPVHSVADLTLEGDPIERELALVKVKGEGEKRVEALRLADAFRARVVDAHTGSFVFEITGKTRKVDQFIQLMKPLGAALALECGAAVGL